MDWTIHVNIYATDRWAYFFTLKISVVVVHLLSSSLDKFTLNRCKFPKYIMIDYGGYPCIQGATPPTKLCSAMDCLAHARQQFTSQYTCYEHKRSMLDPGRQYYH